MHYRVVLVSKHKRHQKSKAVQNRPIDTMLFLEITALIVFTAFSSKRTIMILLMISLTDGIEGTKNSLL